MARSCFKCGGLTVWERLEDQRASADVIEGYRCLNCGACGELPNATWKNKPVGVQAHRVLVCR